jgi:tetratricopeptide (TPR) repeat protein
MPHLHQRLSQAGSRPVAQQAQSNWIDFSFSTILSDALSKVQVLPTNRAALSLLGMSFYYLGRYESACQVYETLVRHHQSSVYRLYHAQSLYKAGDLVEAGRVLEAVSEYTEQVEQLKIAILYAMDQTQECRSMLRASSSKAHANVQNEGCMLYKEGKYRCQLGHALLLVGARWTFSTSDRRLSHDVIAPFES